MGIHSHIFLTCGFNLRLFYRICYCCRICHILNVTREIDNFFPGTFDYLNVRVYDDDNTDLLKHWDNTYKYINRVKLVRIIFCESILSIFYYL